MRCVIYIKKLEKIFLNIKELKLNGKKIVNLLMKWKIL